MPQTVTPIIEDIADTSLILRVVFVSASQNVSAGTVFVCDTTSGSITMTLPTAGQYRGRTLIFKKTVAANTLTIDGNGSETIDGALTQALTAQYASLTIVSDGTTWHIA